jgi:hypothetical protein
MSEAEPFEQKLKEIGLKLFRDLKALGEIKTKWQALCEYKNKNPTQWQDSDQDKEMRMLAFRLVQVGYVLAFVLGVLIALVAAPKQMILENQNSQGVQFSPEPEHYAYTTMEEWGRQKTFQVAVKPGQTDQEAIDDFRRQEQYQSQVQSLQSRVSMPKASTPIAIPPGYVQQDPQRSGLLLMPLSSNH